MSQKVQGVVARGKGAPVTVETVVVPDPGPGEAVVKVQACGVCHTDLHYREGGINDDFPFLLGHEAAGEVEAVGDGVANVAPGDRVRVLPNMLPRETWEYPAPKEQSEDRVVVGWAGSTSHVEDVRIAMNVMPAIQLGRPPERKAVHRAGCGHLRLPHEINPARDNLERDRVIFCRTHSGAAERSAYAFPLRS